MPTNKKKESKQPPQGEPSNSTASSPSTPQDKQPIIVDIHTHMYPPSYIKLLQSRDTIPLIRSFPGQPDPRLVLLPSEVPLLSNPSPSQPPGRPLTDAYTSLDAKIAFMDKHNISISVLSLANPWLEFLSSSPDPNSAVQPAIQINAEFEYWCQKHPGRLYFFGCLPLHPEETVQVFVAAQTLKRTLRHCRGVIVGTNGLGKGLDDPDMLVVFGQLQELDLPVFLHPHYGLPNEVFGERAEKGEYGHVLSLGLGFPMETTVAVARMYLAGVFDKYPNLKVILAHGGGTLPFLAGRIESCVRHDAYLYAKEKESGKKRRSIWEVLKSQIYLDAVVYSEVGLKAAIAASGEGGVERVMFGTDHPFFPPLEEGEEEWGSVAMNKEAAEKALGEGSKEAEMVLGGNAVEILRLGEDCLP
ncbi:putative uracil-5-carboxylate decarboxylase [Triangularia setosa]|uniref:Uracil-5-carboxylate decarboxylase n=1 Tax=Triangularia setosa TaxID=2587417 RepID=A0AAN7ABY5_9PEZI|nr:putative uracil-5-carboxylate decarboxylase [Podospora setosa]